LRHRPRHWWNKYSPQQWPRVIYVFKNIYIRFLAYSFSLFYPAFYFLSGYDITVIGSVLQVRGLVGGAQKSFSCLLVVGLRVLRLVRGAVRLHQNTTMKQTVFAYDCGRIPIILICVRTRRRCRKWIPLSDHRGRRILHFFVRIPRWLGRCRLR
jgi:hypothetical protein